MKSILTYLEKHWVISLVALVLIAAAWVNYSGTGGYYPEYATTDYYYDDYGKGGGGYEMAYEESTMTSMVADRSMMVDSSYYDPSVDQKIIKTASIELHVDDVREQLINISSLVDQWNGIVTTSNVSRGDTSYTGWMTLRVPAENFDFALQNLRDLALYVNYEYVNAEDVTESYMDLDARLTNLQAEEQQYLSIMDRAETVEDVLNVTNALYEVRYEIESIETQLQYYDTRIDYSTISLTLTEDESAAVASEKWLPWSTLQGAYSDWIVFLQGLVDDVIYLVIFGWPIILVALFFWLKRRRK